MTVVHFAREYGRILVDMHTHRFPPASTTLICFTYCCRVLRLSAHVLSSSYESSTASISISPSRLFVRMRYSVCFTSRESSILSILIMYLTHFNLRQPVSWCRQLSILQVCIHASDPCVIIWSSTQTCTGVVLDRWTAGVRR